MTKITFNACYGGFSLSQKAIARYHEIRGVAPDENFYDRDIPRNDTALAHVVEELGAEANGDCAKLAIRELAPGTQYRIDEYDGNETVVTRDEDDWSVA